MRTTVLFLLFLIELVPANTYSQWIETTGPGGIDIYSMLADSNNIWLGTGKGIYLTTNNGTYWYKRSSGIPTGATYVQSILVKGNYMFAAPQNLGIYVSTDQGMSWNPVNNGIPGSSTFYSLQTINNVVLAGGYSGVYLTTNLGVSWIQPNSGNPTNVKTMFVNGNVIFAGTSSIYKSTDNGFNWSLASNGINQSSQINSFARIGTSIFVANSSTVYMTTDNGANWILQSSGFPYSVACLSSQGSNLFQGTSNNFVYKSTDLGVTWNLSSTGIYAPQTVGIVTSGNNLFVGTYFRGGIFLSTNQGSVWSSVNTNLTNLGIYDICVSNNYIYAATQYMGVQLTTDNGDNWKNLYPQLPAVTFNAVAASANYAFAGNYNNIYRSTNYGANWSQVYSSICNSLAISKGILLAGTSNGIIRSTDFGITWATTYSSTAYSFTFSGNYIYAGGSGQILLSSDYGVTWNPLLSGGFGSVRGLSTYNNMVYAGTSSGVLKTTNMGITWFYVNNGLGSTNIQHLVMYNNNPVVVSDNIYISLDNGNSWTIVSYGLVGSLPQRLAINYPYAFVGTFDLSIWRRPISELLGIEDYSNIVVKDFGLIQNYPNPFNPSTVITYLLSKSSYVKLNVFDAAGREVTVITNGYKKAGLYKEQFDAGNLPSGVYFYKIQAGDYFESKKMVLLK